MSSRTRYSVFALALFIAIIILAYKLKSPFGFIFWTGFYLFWLGLIGLISALALHLFSKRKFLTRGLSFLLGIVVIGLSSLVIIGTFDYRKILPLTTTNLKFAQIEEDVAHFNQSYRQHPAIKDSIRISSILPVKSDTDLLSHLHKTTAKLEDGHSYVTPFQFFDRSRYIPLQGHLFDDGFYILKTSSEYNSCKGLKLVEINGIPIQDVISIIRNRSGAENQWNAYSRLNFYLFSVSFLEYIGITDNNRDLIWTFENPDGELVKKNFHSEPFLNYLFWALKPVVNPMPILLHLRKPNFRLLENEGNLLLELNLIEDVSDELKFIDFVGQVDDKLKSKNFTSIIIDLRNNLGGNNTLYEPLIELLEVNAVYNKPYRLFAFTSRNTFSAGINFLDALKFRTNVMLIGEPTGAPATHYGDAKLHILPNSGIIYFMSTKQWESLDSTHNQDAIYPEIDIIYRYKDYINSKDPWMTAIHSF